MSEWTSDDWATPPQLFAELNQEFGPFDLDPCARPETAKAPTFFTKEDNGLLQKWWGRVYVNPPYSSPPLWAQKAHASVYKGEAERVVMLLPAATDTGWFHDLILPYATIRFLRGRVYFLGPQGTPLGRPRFPSMLAIFRK